MGKDLINKSNCLIYIIFSILFFAIGCEIGIKIGKKETSKIEKSISKIEHLYEKQYVQDMIDTFHAGYMAACFDEKNNKFIENTSENFWRQRGIEITLKWAEKKKMVK